MLSRTNCPFCASLTKVKRSVQLSPTVREIRYQCENFDCGATWVAHLSVSYVVSPPGPAFASAALERNLPVSMTKPAIASRARRINDHLSDSA